MPVIYQGYCSACCACTEAIPGSYMAVCLDEPPPSEFAHPDDPHLVMLAHPLETLILEEMGISHEAAAWGGRLVLVEQVFCRSCGRMFEIRRLTAGLSALGGYGCLGGAVFIATGTGAGILIGDWVGGSVGLILSGLVLEWIGGRIDRHVRRRHAERAASVDTPAACPECGSPKYTRVGLFRGRIPCRQCGRRTVRLRSVGIS